MLLLESKIMNEYSPPLQRLAPSSAHIQVLTAASEMLAVTFAHS